MSETIYDPGMPAGAHHVLSEPAVAPLSSLDELRLAVRQAEEVAEAELADHDLFSPGGHIRLTCSTELEQADFKRIQMSGIPKQFRSRRIPDIRKMDESVVYAALIGQQTVVMALLQPDGSYKPVEHADERPFNDPRLLAQLGAAEPSVAVRAIFARDAYLIRAGMELQEACGYGERKPGEPGEDADPT